MESASGVPARGMVRPECSQGSIVGGNMCVITLTSSIVAEEAALTGTAIVGVVKAKNPRWEDVRCSDVKEAIVNQFGVEALDVTVTKTYRADFLIKTNSCTRQEILKKGAISSSDFCLGVKPWSRELGSEELEQNVKVVVDVKGLPEHVSTAETVTELLRPYCMVESVYDPISYWPGYRVDAWTTCVSAIPSIVYLGVREPIFGTRLSVEQQDSSGCIKLKRYPIELEAKLYKWSADDERHSDIDSDYDYDSDREPKSW